MPSTHQLINPSKAKMTGFAVSLAVVGMFTAASIGSASAAPLDKVDLSVAGSVSDGSGNSASTALRVVSADQLENTGIGLQSTSTHSNGSNSSNKLMLQSTDYGQNVTSATDNRIATDDGGTAGTTSSLKSDDYAQNLQGSGWLWGQDKEGSAVTGGLTGTSSNYGQDGASVDAQSKQTSAGAASSTGIRFGFED